MSATADRPSIQDLPGYLSDLLAAAASASRELDFLEKALECLGRLARVERVGAYENCGGIWQEFAGWPRRNTSDRPTTDFLASVADSGLPEYDGAWFGLQLGRGDSNEIVALRSRDSGLEGTRVASAIQYLEELRRLVRKRRDSEMWLTLGMPIAESLVDLNRLNLDRLQGKLRATLDSCVGFWGASSAEVYVGSPASGSLPMPATDRGQLIPPEEMSKLWTALRSSESFRGTPTTLEGSSIVAAAVRSLDESLMACLVLARVGEEPFLEGDSRQLAQFAGLASPLLIRLGELAKDAGLRRTSRTPTGLDVLGNSPAMEEVQRRIARVAATDLAVLVLGENGTGKEIVSQTIHALSSRAKRPFLAVNCAALTESLLESELFGHEKGAFTDAQETRAGKFELAHGGTLMLDEVGEMSPRAQAKLLRVLDDRVVTRVGGHEPIRVDARVIAATNRDLAAMVREKAFREDLYFRLNVVAIELPPLRARGDDILLLAERFLAEFSEKGKRSPPRLAASARERILHHPWPGNVRELRNLMERLCYLHAGEEITEKQLGLPTSGDPSTLGIVPEYPLSEATRQFQVSYIQQQIEACAGNMTDAANRLGLHRTNLYRKMKQLGLKPSELNGDNP